MPVRLTQVSLSRLLGFVKGLRQGFRQGFRWESCHCCSVGCEGGGSVRAGACGSVCGSKSDSNGSSCSNKSNKNNNNKDPGRQLATGEAKSNVVSYAACSTDEKAGVGWVDGASEGLFAGRGIKWYGWVTTIRQS